MHDLESAHGKIPTGGRVQNHYARGAPLSKVLKVTAIYALIPEQITGKFKLAQNKTEAERKRIISRLRERGAPMDLKVADAIQKALAE